MENTIKTEKQFKPTDPTIIEQTIGRDPKEFLKRNPPVFEPALKTYSDPNIKWKLSLERVR